MEIPAYQPFYIHSPAELRAEIHRLGLTIPLDEDPALLGRPLRIGQCIIPNRLCAQPIAGNDAQPNGAPSPLTKHRYRRYAEGRFGLIWIEKTAVGSPEKAGQLCLNESTVATFRELVTQLRTSAAGPPVIVLQITPAHPDSILQGAKLAVEAGFDAIDLQCPREQLPEAFARVRKAIPNLLLAARLCVYEGVRRGFGTCSDDYRKPDLSGPIRLVESLHANGLALLNVTSTSPTLRGPERGARSRSDSAQPDEHPLMTVERQLKLAQTLREAVPDLPVVGSGFGWLRHFASQVATGAIRSGMMDIAGLGRGALAYPTMPAEIFEKGKAKPESACMVCFACSQLHDNGDPVGCVIRDAATYGPIYRQMRRLDADTLLAGATRCHLCEAAPCVTASPTHTDIPGFLQAYRNGDEAGAYEIIRERDPLPELTARLSPAWLETEGACIETTLAGSPVPILDLQYTIAWRARERGATGVRFPSHASGKVVAIIGGGPTGISAAIRLIEFGHTVDLFEKADRLGGVPERLLARHRGLASPTAEIDAIFRPALEAGRLRIQFGATLGKNLSLTEVRATHNAVLVAVGLWKERSLGTAGDVIGALDYLEMAEPAVHERVVILAGGDSAMDAARVVQSRGAKEIFIVYGGPRSAMHWHMPESWFATAGVQAMMSWQPLSYATGSDGKVTGVRLRHSEFEVETTLPAGMVIEAMGLEADEKVGTGLAATEKFIYTAGAMVNGGASVGRCVADGLAIAETIHKDIS